MEIFLDTANMGEIERWVHDYSVVDGVTTNPSIMLAEGALDVKTHTKRIASVLGDRPLSVEVVSDDRDEMLAQAREMATWAANIVVKIPIVTTSGEPCLGTIHRLVEDGIRVNATACLSFGQAMLAAKAGASYVSLFGGRIGDEGGDAAGLVRSLAQWLARWQSPTRLIVGSIREAFSVQEAALAGAHVVTVPPRFLRQLVDHKYSRFTVQQFLDDGREAVEQLRHLQAAAGLSPDGDAVSLGGAATGSGPTFRPQ